MSLVTEYIECACNYFLHSIKLSWDTEDEKELLIEFIIPQSSLWERISAAANYIFRGTKITIGENLLVEEDIKKLKSCCERALFRKLMN